MRKKNTGFSVSYEGITSRNSQLLWQEVIRVQLAMIHKPGVRTTQKHIRITNKKGAHLDYDITEVNDLNSDIPKLVKAYYQLYLKTTVNKKPKGLLRVSQRSGSFKKSASKKNIKLDKLKNLLCGLWVNTNVI